jgi:hypothetical protein
VPHYVPERWQPRLRDHIRLTTGQERDTLRAHDFSTRRSVRLAFPDGSFALFRYAFYLRDDALEEIAVFTEHCGYHYFAAGDLMVEVLESVRQGEPDAGVES